MEKFGIFELLDALSAMTALTPAPPPSPAQDGEEAAKIPEKRTPDAAFAPPNYGTETPQTSSGSTAYEGFLARHQAARDKAKR